ncbi:hypothetical protein KR222_007438, partial [Zaprionus bogoriensis]
NNERELQVNLNAWQPLGGHNNWLILQATAATSMQRQQKQEEEHQQQAQPQPQRLPVNYYAYNHRYNPRSNTENDAVGAGGNYKQVRPNLNDSPSYVLAISQTMRRGGNGDSLPVVDIEEEQQQQEEKRAPRRQLMAPALKDVQEVNMRAVAEQEVRDADGFVALTNAADVVADDALDDMPEQPPAPVRQVDNYLAPFEQAVVTVRNFCDALRSLISLEAEEEVTGTENATTLFSLSIPADAAASKLDVRARATALAATSKEVQGRSTRLATLASLARQRDEGRKLKKLKKKIQKLLLPLLIAYKLKFLTLIPVLIGGLTLLVGTTGLAGFFFALFTAVMSLKTSTGAGHGSKSIVLKKI